MATGPDYIRAGRQEKTMTPDQLKELERIAKSSKDKMV